MAAQALGIVRLIVVCRNLWFVAPPIAKTPTYEYTYPVGISCMGVMIKHLPYQYTCF